MKAQISQNPLQDEKWLKKFAEDWKKDTKQSPKRKATSHQWISEINCTQEDIGQPHYSPKKGKNR